MSVFIRCIDRDDKQVALQDAIKNFRDLPIFRKYVYTMPRFVFSTSGLDDFILGARSGNRSFF